jgi:ribosomal protein L11 methyltransferase
LAWVQLRAVVEETHVDMLSELLMAQGALSVSYTAVDGEELFHENLNSSSLWQDTAVIGLFEHCRYGDMPDVIANIQAGDNVFLAVEFSVSELEDQDWARITQQQFEPLLIANRLWVCPSWCDVKDERPVVLLDPGLAFGTGRHPTTQLCLAWLSEQDFRHQTMIDYGCGSGVLALAALALGASTIYAVDHDVQAMEATTNNMQLNRILDDQKLKVMLADDLPKICVPILLANILANPLCQLAERFATLVEPGGVVVLSGLQEQNLPAIREAYSAFFVEHKVRSQEEWLLMVWRKPE